jgi:hypothetical protein
MEKYTQLVLTVMEFITYCVSKVQSVIKLMQVVCIVTTMLNELRM